VANVPNAKLIQVNLVDWLTCTVNPHRNSQQTLGLSYYLAKRGVPPRDPLTQQISLQRTM